MPDMKKLLAICLVLATTQASAFWGWNDSVGSGNGYSNGWFDGVGNGEADFTFDFDMSARMNFDGMGYGDGRTYGNGYGHGYHQNLPYYAAPYGYAPMAPPPAPVR
jgi:hypothetical protein